MFKSQEGASGEQSEENMVNLDLKHNQVLLNRKGIAGTRKPNGRNNRHQLPFISHPLKTIEHQSHPKSKSKINIS